MTIFEQLKMPPWAFRLLQTAWFAVGVSFAAWHSRLNGTGPDGISIGLLIFAVAGFILPLRPKLKIGGNTFELEQAATAATAFSSDLETTLIKLALLTRGWTGLVARVRSVSRMETSSAQYQAFGAQMCEEAIGDAQQWLVNEEETQARVTLWTYRSNEDVLRFAVGNVTEEERRIFALDAFTLHDDDYIGDAWRNSRIVNVADAPEEFRAYNKSPDGTLFHGIMFVPVQWRGRPWGLLEIDREKRDPFGSIALSIASALGNVMAAVLAETGVSA